MGVGRELFKKVLLGALALGSGFAWAAPPLGSSRQNEISPDENKLITNFESCALRLEDLSRAAQVLSPDFPSFEGETLSTLPISASFRNKTLSLELLPESVTLMGLRIAQSPSQMFLLGSRESYHKMVNDLARFGGYYLLYPLSEAPEQSKLGAFLRSRFASVGIESPDSSLTGDFILVPVHQIVAFSDLLKGTDAALHFEAEARPEPPAPQFYPMPYSSGVVVTGRGTVYVFGENGTVSVQPRRGERKEYRLAKTQKAYGSHAAILERQGVKQAPADPVKALEMGLSRNEGTIGDYLRSTGVALAERGVHAAEMEEIRRQYLDAQGRWAESEKARVLDHLLRTSIERASYLPEFLRMSRIVQSDLLTAPLDERGGKQRRVLRRFIAVRNPAGLQDYPFGLELRLVHDDCMHLQSIHASFGSLALTLDQEGLLAGGVLAFTYSETGQLQSIQIEDNGFISMVHGESARHEVLEDELDFLAKQIRKSLTGTPAESAQVFTSAPDQESPLSLEPAAH